MCGEYIRLDDLQYKGLMLYQRADLPGFTQDSVLLASFVDIKPADKAVDIGAGTGVLSILAGVRTGADFTCIEKEAAFADLLRRSLAYNHLQYRVCEMDWAQAPQALGHGVFTAAICNPPYFAGGTKSGNAARAAARGGEDALEGAVKCAAVLLKNGGRFYVCYPAARLTDLLLTLRQYGLETKRLRLVAQRGDKAPYLALVMARKGGKPGLHMLPLLVLKDETGADTEEIRQIYHQV